MFSVADITPAVPNTISGTSCTQMQKGPRVHKTFWVPRIIPLGERETRLVFLWLHRALSHLPCLAQTFRLFSLVGTKFTGVKTPPDCGPDQTAEPWSDDMWWPRSRSNWPMVQFVPSVKTFFVMVQTLCSIMGSSGRLSSEPERKKKQTTKQNELWKPMLRRGELMFVDFTKSRLEKTFPKSFNYFSRGWEREELNWNDNTPRSDACPYRETQLMQVMTTGRGYGMHSSLVHLHNCNVKAKLTGWNVYNVWKTAKLGSDPDSDFQVWNDPSSQEAAGDRQTMNVGKPVLSDKWNTRYLNF